MCHPGAGGRSPPSAPLVSATLRRNDPDRRCCTKFPKPLCSGAPVGAQPLFLGALVAPVAYFQAAVKLSHVVKVDLNVSQERPKTTNDLLDRMEQQLGARGRELLTKFIESLDKLEREEQAS